MVAENAEAVVTAQWASLRSSFAEYRDRLALEDHDHPLKYVLDLIDACAARPRLRQLYPVTSHELLFFSRVTEYPFTYDSPYGVPRKDGIFRVGRMRSDIVYGEGDAIAAARMIEEHLPPGCGPAVLGTAVGHADLSARWVDASSSAALRRP